MIVYDLEIKRLIRNKNEAPIAGFEYCNGWGDYKGMGISVACAFDTSTKVYYTLLPEDSMNDRDILQGLFNQTDCIVGFNNHIFDDRLLAAFGVRVDPFKSYDIFRVVAKAAGQRKGCRLDDVARVNGLYRKNDEEGGALAPVLYQRGDIGRLHRYCLNDVTMTFQVLKKIMEGDLLCPVSEQPINVEKARGVWNV